MSDTNTQRDTNKHDPWITWVAIGVVAVFLGLWIQQPYDKLSASVPKMAVVDVERLVGAKAYSASSSGTALSTEAVGFAEKLKAETVRLSGDGYVVVNSAHLVGWPPEMDVTKDIATRLGVDLSAYDKAQDALNAERSGRVQQLVDRAKPQ